MKTTLPKESKEHEANIYEIKDIILKSYGDKISHIILFGSFARGNWVYDYYQENGHDLEYASDYDFLILTKKSKNGSGVQRTRFESDASKKLDKFFRPNIPHKPTVIVESFDRFNKELEKGQYFFSDIKNEGILLYKCEDDKKDPNRYKFKEARELINEEIKEIAQENFEHWFKKGNEFLDNTLYKIKKTEYSNAAFQLHQATESLINCSLLVLTGYKPKSHDLKTLLSLCSSQSNKFLSIFPTGNKEQEDCFELLRKAYIDARYEKSYKINPDQLNYLIERVEKLKEITQETCKKRIELLN